MIRCKTCESTLKPDEITCYACGANVAQKEDAKHAFAKRFASSIHVLFIASAVLTVASLFFSATPSFAKCLTTTLVLLFVKSSASQMLEKKG